MTSNIITSKEIQAVRHAEEFKLELLKLYRVKIGVVFVRTREIFRCQDAIHSIIYNGQINGGDFDDHSQLFEFKSWDILKGWHSFADAITPLDSDETDVDVSTPKSTDGMMDIGKALNKLEKEFLSDGFYVMQGAQFALEFPAVQQFIKVHTQNCLDQNKCLVFIVPEGFSPPANIENDIYILDFKTPSYIELKEALDQLLEEMSLTQECLSHFTENDFGTIVQNAVGMSLLEFETAISIAIIENEGRLNPKGAKLKKKGKGKLTNEKGAVTPQEIIEVLMRFKVEVIKKTELLELMPTATMDNVGGLDLLKKWLNVRKESFSDEAKDFGVDQPRGMLVVGPPGTGKSLLAKATASIFGVPCIKFDMSRVFGQYVGQSESAMRKALKMVESMAPCCLMIDEIDKGLGGIGGTSDSGTTSRVFGTLLTWLQERNNASAPIFVIMTANNVTNLPPELMRRGRLDEIFSVTFPTKDERKMILKIHVEKRKHTLEDADYEEIAKHTPDFVGSELESIVSDALIECFYNKKPTLTRDSVIAQARAITPLSKAFAEKVNNMRAWAEQNAKPSSGQVATVKTDGETKPRVLLGKKRKLKINHSDLSSN